MVPSWITDVTFFKASISSNGLPSRTAKSAAFPSAIEPVFPSTPQIRAALIVIPAVHPGF